MFYENGKLFNKYVFPYVLNFCNIIRTLKHFVISENYYYFPTKADTDL